MEKPAYVYLNTDINFVLLCKSPGYNITKNFLWRCACLLNIQYLKKRRYLVIWVLFGDIGNWSSRFYTKTEWEHL